MSNLPSKIKFTNHARIRLGERNDSDIRYNTKNLILSSSKWYTIDDIIQNSDLYMHCKYTCRRSNQIAYLTDGKIEVIYDKKSNEAITVLKLPDKFKPVTRFIKPEVLAKIKRKKEDKQLKKMSNKKSSPLINEDSVMQYFKITSLPITKITELVTEKL